MTKKHEINKAAESPTVDITEIFSQTTSEIANISTADEMLVDVELSFKSVVVEKSASGNIFKLKFSREHKQESLEIRLATRVRCTPKEPK